MSNNIYALRDNNTCTRISNIYMLRMVAENGFIDEEGVATLRIGINSNVQHALEFKLKDKGAGLEVKRIVNVPYHGDCIYCGYQIRETSRDSGVQGPLEPSIRMYTLDGAIEGTVVDIMPGHWRDDSYKYYDLTLTVVGGTQVVVAAHLVAAALEQLFYMDNETLMEYVKVLTNRDIRTNVNHGTHNTKNIFGLEVIPACMNALHNRIVISSKYVEGGNTFIDSKYHVIGGSSLVMLELLGALDSDFARETLSKDAISEIRNNILGVSRTQDLVYKLTTWSLINYVIDMHARNRDIASKYRIAGMKELIEFYSYKDSYLSEQLEIA